MGQIVAKSFPLRPYYPPSQPLVLSKHDKQMYRALRLVIAGWALGAFVKANSLRDINIDPGPLFKLTLRTTARNYLKRFYFFTWYMASRLVVTASGSRSWLKKVSLLLRYHDPRLVALVAMASMMTVEEITFAVNHLFFNAKSNLVGDPIDCKACDLEERTGYAGDSDADSDDDDDDSDDAVHPPGFLTGSIAHTHLHGIPHSQWFHETVGRAHPGHPQHLQHHSSHHSNTHSMQFRGSYPHATNPGASARDGSEQSRWPSQHFRIEDEHDDDDDDNDDRVDNGEYGPDAVDGMSEASYEEHFTKSSPPAISIAIHKATSHMSRKHQRQAPYSPSPPRKLEGVGSPALTPLWPRPKNRVPPPFSYPHKKLYEERREVALRAIAASMQAPRHDTRPSHHPQSATVTVNSRSYLLPHGSDGTAHCRPHEPMQPPLLLPSATTSRSRTAMLASTVTTSTSDGTSTSVQGLETSNKNLAGIYDEHIVSADADKNHGPEHGERVGHQQDGSGEQEQHEGDPVLPILSYSAVARGSHADRILMEGMEGNGVVEHGSRPSIIDSTTFPALTQHTLRHAEDARLASSNMLSRNFTSNDPEMESRETDGVLVTPRLLSPTLADHTPQSSEETRYAALPAHTCSLCCICREPQQSRRLFSFCAAGSHAAHWDCMQAWYESGQHLAHCCPMCRSPLRVQPAPLHDRVVIVLLSSDYWQSVANRTLTTIGCTALSLFVYTSYNIAFGNF